MKKKKQKHWTTNYKSFEFFTVSCFLESFLNYTKKIGIQQIMLDVALEESLDTISKIFDSCKMSLYKMVKWTRKLGLKFAILVYDDNDPENILGPIFPDVFIELWELHGKPRDMWDLKEIKEEWKEFKKSKK